MVVWYVRYVDNGVVGGVGKLLVGQWQTCRHCGPVQLNDVVD